MIGAPTPPPGQFGITSVGGGYQMPQRGGGISPGGYPAMPQRGQPPAFAPPVPAMGQRPPPPGVQGGFSGMNPGGVSLGGFPANQNALVAPVPNPQMPGMRSQGQGVNMGQWNGFDLDGLRAWLDSRPVARDYRGDGGFDRSGFQGAIGDWFGQAPWHGSGTLPAPGGAPAGPAPQQAPFTRALPPQGMVGQSYDVQGLIPSGSPYQFPTYNFGG